MRAADYGLLMDPHEPQQSCLLPEEADSWPLELFDQ